MSTSTSTSTRTRVRAGFRPAYFLGRPSGVYAARYARVATVTTLPTAATTDRAA